MENRHLNVFENYTENNPDNPIENNLSRGYAILLKQCPELLYMLIERINEKCESSNETMVRFPYDDYDVDFQLSAKDVDGVDEIIGVTLTTVDLSSSIENTPLNSINGKSIDDFNNLITDITVNFNNRNNDINTLIIIEVKRTNEDCVQQLNSQIECAVCANNQKEGSFDSMDICKKRISITWTEVIDMIEGYNKLKLNSDVLSNYYYQYIVSKHPKWVRTKNLSELSPDKEIEINKRIANVLDSMKVDSEENPTDYSFDKSNLSIGLKKEFRGFVNRMDFGYTKSSNRNNEIYMMMWPSNTKGQFYNFMDLVPNYKFLCTTRHIERICSKEIRVEISPFIKFYDRKQISPLFFCNDELKKIKEFMESHTGRYNRSNWKNDFFDEICKMMNDNEQKKLTEIINSIEESNRTIFNVCLSFEVTAYISYEEAQKLDKDSKLKDFLVSVADTLPQKLINE